MRRGRWALPGPSSQRGQRLATSCFSTFWKAPAFPGHGAPPPSLFLRAWVPHHFSFPHPLPPRLSRLGSHLPHPSPLPLLPIFSHPLSHSPLFSPSRVPVRPPQGVEEETEAEAARSHKPRLCPPRPLSLVTFLLFCRLSLCLSVCLCRCPHLYLRLSLALQPGAYSVQSSHHALPVPGPPATCPEVSSGGAGWRFPGPYGSLLPGLSPERDPARPGQGCL